MEVDVKNQRWRFGNYPGEGRKDARVGFSLACEGKNRCFRSSGEEGEVDPGV